MNYVFDPYDIWAIPVLGKLKADWSKGRIYAKLILPFVGVAEIFAPCVLRVFFRAPKHVFSNSCALEYFYANKNMDRSHYLVELKSLKSHDRGWGLPFGWYSKNGVYPAGTSFITHSLYPIEALLDMSTALSAIKAEEAKKEFYSTWLFLQKLVVMYESDSCLALSYAPIDEPRLVINANSYAAAAYALHAKHGLPEYRDKAVGRVRKLVNWILSQQHDDGSWFYYADDEPGNFIDCFHSCFIVKNLLKVQAELPELETQIRPAVEAGWQYIRDQLYDPNYRLCRRFAKRSHRDPFRWDLYDQAEYLGLLVDFGLHDEALQFAEHVQLYFSKNGKWFCRIDIFGRRWGKDFLRWGIAPFHYHRYRLLKQTTGEA